jgi:hypothetical protein
MVWRTGCGSRCSPSSATRATGIHRFSPGRRPALLIYRVIRVDEDTTMWTAEDLGNLRLALNALTRVFRLDRA